MDFKCKNCGGKLSYHDGDFVVKCDFCGAESLIFDYLDKESEEYDEISEEIIARKEEFEKKYLEYADDVLNADSYCLTANDFEKIIAFFENAGEYRDSKDLIPLAKLEFCRKISTFAQSVQALYYLDELPKDLISNTDAFKQAILDAGTAFRIEELSLQHVTVITPSNISFESVLKVMTDLHASAMVSLDGFNDFDKALSERSQREAVEFLNEHLDEAVELADSYEQMTALWNTLGELREVFPSVGTQALGNAIVQKMQACKAEEDRRAAEEARIKAEQEEKAKRRIRTRWTVLGIIALAIVVVVVVMIDGYSARHLQIEVVDKINVDFNENLADGQYQAGYFYDFELEITNNSIYEMKTIKGVLVIENEDGDKLASTTVELHGKFLSKETQTATFQLNVAKGDEARELWNTDLEDLKITFRAKTIHFDSETKQYANAKTIVIHEPGKGGKRSDDEKSDDRLSKEEEQTTHGVSKEVYAQFEQALDAYADVDIYSATFEADITDAVALLDDIWEQVAQAEELLAELYAEAETYESYEGYEKAYFLYALLAAEGYADSEVRMQDCYDVAVAYSY